MKNRSILNHALKTCKSLTMNSRQMGQVRGPSIIFLPLKAEEVRKKEGKKRDREGCGSKSVRARMITSLFHDKKTKKKKKKELPHYGVALPVHASRHVVTIEHHAVERSIQTDLAQVIVAVIRRIHAIRG